MKLTIILIIYFIDRFLNEMSGNNKYLFQTAQVSSSNVLPQKNHYHFLKNKTIPYLIITALLIL